MGLLEFPPSGRSERRLQGNKVWGRSSLVEKKVGVSGRFSLEAVLNTVIMALLPASYKIAISGTNGIVRREK